MPEVQARINALLAAGMSEMLRKRMWDLLVVDEAHDCRNADRLRFRFVYSLRARRRVFLTATPIHNSGYDMFNLATLLKPGYLGQRRFFAEKHMAGDRIIKDNDVLQRRLAPLMARSLRRETDILFAKTIDQWIIANGTSEEAKQQIWGPRKNCQNQRVYVGARANHNGKDEDVLALEPQYRARPLDGVWATAPYLHNGSVPTLRDMLLPQKERPMSFCVGSREFDPVNVGLVTKTQASDACAAGLTEFSVSLLGNGNRGHSFEGKETDLTKLPPGVIGPELTDAERRALVEYLKTL
ncbi:di-heme-cytochrome C peroxidase [Bradyrhizobium sp. NDS-1]|uniref:di-heme-cytochrome C peroxidase n=1 Tax=Bradyrhizobium sp. NDS-1 TaxID=3080014 RepID=UPI00293F4824|nr:di-heme-cytochrome C peroxidase [Bradyrhizobium sp. NDS-1]WOH75412.1 di-heme-cytochrome C peroxidase [Bradyrhizobium sp. NDS-1]